jgi:hypothetical protein
MLTIVGIFVIIILSAMMLPGTIRIAASMWLRTIQPHDFLYSRPILAQPALLRVNSKRGPYGY